MWSSPTVIMDWPVQSLECRSDAVWLSRLSHIEPCNFYPSFVRCSLWKNSVPWKNSATMRLPSFVQRSLKKRKWDVWPDPALLVILIQAPCMRKEPLLGFLIPTDPMENREKPADSRPYHVSPAIWTNPGEAALPGTERNYPIMSPQNTWPTGWLHIVSDSCFNPLMVWDSSFLRNICQNQILVLEVGFLI